MFNEMKGVYSSPDSVNQRAVQHSLFPDNTYGEDSGGDPKVIPELTFEEFKVLPSLCILTLSCTQKPLCIQRFVGCTSNARCMTS